MTEAAGSESRETRRQPLESFAIPVGQIVGIPAVLVVVLAVLFLFSADIVLILGLLAAAFGVGSLIVRQLRGSDAGKLPPASPTSRVLGDPGPPHGDAPVPRAISEAAGATSVGPTKIGDSSVPAGGERRNLLRPGEARIVGAWKVIEAEPGAPVPPGAERCDLVETPEYTPERRRWLIVSGVAVAIGSVVLRIYTGWGMGFLAASGVMLYRALFENTRTTVTLSPTGRYLAFDAGIPHAESGMDEAARFIPLVVGLVGVVVGGVVWVSGAAPRFEALLFAALGIYGLYRGVRGPDAGDEPLAQVPSLRFHALANPDFPLEGAFISGDQGITLAATPRDGDEAGV